MADTSKILVFAGSARKDSWNKKLAAAAAQALEASGATVSLIDLADYPMPIMDEDVESAEGTPPNATRLKALMKSHSGFLICCPEYNSSITPLLKNVIDWTSRGAEGESPLECTANKVVGLASASPGALGGLRGLYHVRDIFLNIRAVVLPDIVAVSAAHTAFDDNGALTDEGYTKRLNALCARMVEVTAAIGK